MEAPGDIVLTSRDKGISYPVCVYPLHDMERPRTGDAGHKF
jgi:hypothetical protein